MRERTGASRGVDRDHGRVDRGAGAAQHPLRDGQPPALEESLFGGVSRTIAPASPRRASTTGDIRRAGDGAARKEVVVSTLGQVYAVGDAEAADEPATLLDDARTIVVGFGAATVDTLKATVSLLPGVDLIGAAAEEDTSAVQAALRNNFTALQAVAFAVFVLLYTPCMATVAALRHEFGARWAWFSVGYMLTVAWVAATLTYQVGRLLGLG